MQTGTCPHCGIQSRNLQTHYDVAHKKQELAKKEARDLQKQAERHLHAVNDTLVIFDEIGVATDTYHLKVTNEELARLKEMHNGFYDVEDEEHLWLSNFLSQFTPLASTEDASEDAPILNRESLQGNLTLICTGVSGQEDGDAEDEEEDEDEFAGSDEEATGRDLSSDPKTYYFHAKTDEDAEDPSQSSYVIIAPKEDIDANKGLCMEFVADYLSLSDKFEEIGPCEFIYDGSLADVAAELVTMGMVANTKLSN